MIPTNRIRNGLFPGADLSRLTAKEKLARILAYVPGSAAGEPNLPVNRLDAAADQLGANVNELGLAGRFSPLPDFDVFSMPPGAAGRESIPEPSFSGNPVPGAFDANAAGAGQVFDVAMEDDREGDDSEKSKDPGTDFKLDPEGANIPSPGQDISDDNAGINLTEEQKKKYEEQLKKLHALTETELALLDIDRIEAIKKLQTEKAAYDRIIKSFKGHEMKLSYLSRHDLKRVGNFKALYGWEALKLPNLQLLKEKIEKVIEALESGPKFKRSAKSQELLHPCHVMSVKRGEKNTIYVAKEYFRFTRNKPDQKIGAIIHEGYHLVSAPQPKETYALNKLFDLANESPNEAWTNAQTFACLITAGSGSLLVCRFDTYCEPLEEPEAGKPEAGKAKAGKAKGG